MMVQGGQIEEEHLGWHSLTPRYTRKEHFIIVDSEIAPLKAMVGYGWCCLKKSDSMPWVQGL